MALTWTDYNNGDSLLDIRNKINTFNSSSAVEVTKNTVDIDNIQTGLGGIIPTPGHIRVKGANPTVELIAEATSTAAQMQVLDVASGRLAATMEWFKATQEFVFTLFDTATGVAKAGFELKQDGKGYIGGEVVHTYHTTVYEHVTATNKVIDSGSGYTPVAALVKVLDAGVYEIKISKTFQYNKTGKSALFRWSLDGGSTWEDFSIEVKDITNKTSESYVFPLTHAGGTLDIKLEAGRESNAGILNIDYANIIVERKK